MLEFYSGVGGMVSPVSPLLASQSPAAELRVWWVQHYALQAAGCCYEVLQALDMNEVANVVYAHNFPSVPVNTVHSHCPSSASLRHASRSAGWVTADGHRAVG